MPRRLSPRLAALLLTLGLATPAAAQLATLVADLNPGTPVFAASSSPRNFVELGGRMLFLAYQPTLGLEWWATDGSVLGTELLADSCPGDCSLQQLYFFAQNEARIVWRASDGNNSPGSYNRYWTSDGSRAGTFPLHGPELELPGDTAAALAGGKLFFAASDGAHGLELFVSNLDGSAPRLVRDIWPGAEASAPREVRALGAGVVFVANDPVHGAALWKSDGTPAGTSFVAPFGRRVLRADSLGNRVVFLVEDFNFGLELWATDGTAAGTGSLGLRAPNQFVEELPILGVETGALFFAWDDRLHGVEVWQTDGTPAGSRPVSNLPAAERVYSSQLRRTAARAGGRIFFLTDLGFGQRFTLWASDGNPNHMVRLGEICVSCSALRNEIELLPSGPRVFFLGQQVGGGQELWTSDGTVAGTHAVAETCPGACGEASDPKLVDGEVFFAGRDAQGRTDLWRAAADGSGATNLTTFGDRAYLDLFSDDLQLGRLGQRLFFQATAQASGEELWTSDGAPGSARLLADLAQESESSNPEHLAALGDALLFGASAADGCPLRSTTGTTTSLVTLTTGHLLRACDQDIGPIVLAGPQAFFIADDGGQFSASLWRTDGAPQGTLKLKQVANQPNFADRLALAALGSQVYFLQGDQNSTSLWRSDGTVAATSELFELPAAATTGDISRFRSLGSKIYFTTQADDGSFRRHLWQTDGTETGTVRLLSAAFASEIPAEPALAVLGDRLFFLAEDEFRRVELWVTESDESAAVKLRTFPSLSFSAESIELVASGDAVYFLADLDQNATALWRSDGELGGTQALATFSVPGPLAGGQGHLTAALGRLFFVAHDGEHGRELWASDGTALGTALFADLVPGADGADPMELTPAGDRLFFTAADSTFGRELWVSDGTALGTRRVHDIAPGPASSRPEQLRVAGNRLYFSANDFYTGRELWSLDLGAAVGSCIAADGALCLSGSRFRVDIAWRDFQNRRGAGHAMPLTADTGYFWFFNPANVETIVKVLDGRPINEHFWTFYGALSNVEYAMTVTDAQTGLTQRYFNPSRQFASVGDTESFGPNGASLASFTSPNELLFQSHEPEISSLFDSSKAGSCAPSSTRLCLNNGRFAVEATWKDFQGSSGQGQSVPLTPDTGYFWFFRDSNVEVVLKVLDGRPLNGKFWVFFGALSNVEYTLTVTDTETGVVKLYRNPLRNFGSVGDTAAF